MVVKEKKTSRAPSPFRDFNQAFHSDVDASDPDGSAAKVVNLYRVALTDQLARLEEDPALRSQEKLAAAFSIFHSLLGLIDRLSRPFPAMAPELWSEKDASNVENINSFILRVYSTYKSQGMTMANLASIDPKAHRAWYDWRKLPKNKGVSPPLPTKSQAADQALARMGGTVSLAGLMDQLPASIRNAMRLQKALSTRRRRSKSPIDAR